MAEMRRTAFKGGTRRLVMVGSLRRMPVCGIVPKVAALVACLGLFGCAGFPFGGTRPVSPRGPEGLRQGSRTSIKLCGCRSARRLLPCPTLQRAALWSRSLSGRIGRFGENMKWTIRSIRREARCASFATFHRKRHLPGGYVKHRRVTSRGVGGVMRRTTQVLGAVALTILWWPVAADPQTASSQAMAPLWTVHIDEVRPDKAAEFERLNIAENKGVHAILRKYGQPIRPVYEIMTTGAVYMSMRPKLVLHGLRRAVHRSRQRLEALLDGNRLSRRTHSCCAEIPPQRDLALSQGGLLHPGGAWVHAVHTRLHSTRQRAGHPGHGGSVQRAVRLAQGRPQEK